MFVECLIYLRVDGVIQQLKYTSYQIDCRSLSRLGTRTCKACGALAILKNNTKKFRNEIGQIMRTLVENAENGHKAQRVYKKMTKMAKIRQKCQKTKNFHNLLLKYKIFQK